MRSLQNRVALGAVAAVAVTLVAVFVIVVSTFASSERRALDRQVQRTAAAVQRASAAGPPPRAQGNPPPLGLPGGALPPPAARRPGPAPGQRTPLARRVRDVSGRNGETVRVVSRTGRVLTSNGPVVDVPLPARAGRVVTEEVAGRTYRVVRRNTLVDTDTGLRIRGHVVVAADTAAMEERISDLRTRVIVAGVIGLLVAGLAALLLARLALRSLERLRDRAADLNEPGADGEHLPRGGPTEVDDLAGTLNAMLDRLAATGREREQALDASRRFAADVGHELRTPLAALGANVDTLRAHPDIPERDAMLAELQGEQRRMAALLGALQALARADAAEAIPREPVDLAELADIAVQAVGRRHPGVTFTLAAPEGATLVSGWPDGLRLALDNLLENAARHGRAGGTVQVTVGAAGDTVSLTVDDDGPGIPPGERERVRERFVRGRGATGTGSGLGLALVAQQAELHGGALDIEDAPQGGARLRLTLHR